MILNSYFDHFVFRFLNTKTLVSEFKKNIRKYVVADDEAESFFATNMSWQACNDSIIFFDKFKHRCV